MRWLDGEVALVTGGGSGIGRAVVDRYVQEGARVVVADLSADRLVAVRDELGDSVRTIVTDVRDIEQNKAAVALAESAFGKLDVFVANAGLGDRFIELADMAEGDIGTAYTQIFDVNVKGLVLGAKAALPALVRTKGSFVVTLSNSSFWPDGGGVLYIASKHAALGVVRQLAHEFAPVVRVNAVAPGATRTNITSPSVLGAIENGGPAPAPDNGSEGDSEVERVTPLRRHASPEDHSAAFVLVASRTQGGIMTGTVIETDAGLGIRGLRRVRGGDNLRERVLGGQN
ncbi:SDR family NAD(P)-dependent oxidoreductase [Streptomyces sp. NPDC057199]|uniref:SDR family NAD(P)-dependent oxidoreductase n=1 Tax=Streptomyces sp. NPDC057199 TaxID=3346047 RepID=UPI00363DAE9E